LHVQYTKEAEKEIKKLDRHMKQRIKQAIERLPLGDIKKLKGYQNDFRLRVGEYRIILSSTNGYIIIKAILPRGEAYKRL